MMIEASGTCEVPISVLATSFEESAVAVASQVIIGSATSYEDLKRFSATCDVLTFDHELVDLDVLRRLEEEGVVLRPSTQTLTYGVNKATQRIDFARRGLPVPAFLVATDPDDQRIASFLDGLNGPPVLKIDAGGYDGRGIYFPTTRSEAEQLISKILTSGSIILEERLELVAEVAQMVARSVDGHVQTYPLVTTVQAEGMCNEVRFPTSLAAPLVAEAERLTRQIADAIDLVGVMAVEYFVTASGIVINELAVRPHNSGHWTIEGCATSQFANHLLAVSGQTLGETTPVVEAAVMVNLIGGEQPGDPGAAMAIAGSYVHEYGKSWRPGRKLGHVTVVGADPALLKVTAWKSARLYGTATQEIPA